MLARSCTLLLLMICIVYAQRPPVMPKTYYMEYVIQDSVESGSIPGAIGYDEPNERQYIRNVY